MSGHIKSGIHGGTHGNKGLSYATVELSLQKVASSRFGKDIHLLILPGDFLCIPVLLSLGPRTLKVALA